MDGTNIDVSEVPRRRVGALEALVASPEFATEIVCQLARDGRQGRHVHLVNAYCVALADSDVSYRRQLGGDAINFPDGKPLSWVSKWRGDVPSLTQVRGPRLFPDVCDRGRDFGIRHFLLGGTDDVLNKVRERLTTEFPGIEIVGTHSPEFRPLTPEETRRQSDLVAAASPDIVWVALGTPKQDYEVVRLAQSLPVIAIAVGAAFDFAAGTVPEAPNWVQRMGIEWAFRLMSEPRRLWKRYLFGNVRFLWAVVRGQK